MENRRATAAAFLLRELLGKSKHACMIGKCLATCFYSVKEFYTLKTSNSPMIYSLLSQGSPNEHDD